MKLKGTFKIRVFEGSDWQRRRRSIDATAAAEATEPSAAGGLGKAIEVASSVPSALASGTATGPSGASGAKAVRFRKEDLLNDLLVAAPPSNSSSSSSLAHNKPVSSGQAPSGRPGGGSGGGGISKSRTSRSSRPLFEVT